MTLLRRVNVTLVRRVVTEIKITAESQENELPIEEARVEVLLSQAPGQLFKIFC